MYISFLCTVTSSLVHSVHIARVAVQMYMCPIGNVEVWFYFIFTFSSINLVWIVIQQVKHVFFVLWVQYYFITFVCFFLTYSTFFGAVNGLKKSHFSFCLSNQFCLPCIEYFFSYIFFPKNLMIWIQNIFFDVDPMYIPVLCTVTSSLVHSVHIARVAIHMYMCTIENVEVMF